MRLSKRQITAITRKIPQDKNGNPLEDLEGNPVKLNSDGSIDLYHATNKDSYDQIKNTGKWKSEEGHDLFFSNFHRGGEGFGDSVVHIRINPKYTSINDAFRNGEVHVSIKIRDVERYGKIIS